MTMTRTVMMAMTVISMPRRVKKTIYLAVMMALPVITTESGDDDKDCDDH